MGRKKQQGQQQQLHVEFPTTQPKRWVCAMDRARRTRQLQRTVYEVCTLHMDQVVETAKLAVPSRMLTILKTILQPTSFREDEQHHEVEGCDLLGLEALDVAVIRRVVAQAQQLLEAQQYRAAFDAMHSLVPLFRSNHLADDIAPATWMVEESALVTTVEVRSHAAQMSTAPHVDVADAPAEGKSLQRDNTWDRLIERCRRWSELGVYRSDLEKMILTEHPSIGRNTMPVNGGHVCRLTLGYRSFDSRVYSRKDQAELEAEAMLHVAVQQEAGVKITLRDRGKLKKAHIKAKIPQVVQLEERLERAIAELRGGGTQSETPAVGMPLQRDSAWAPASIAGFTDGWMQPSDSSGSCWRATSMPMSVFWLGPDQGITSPTSAHAMHRSSSTLSLVPTCIRFTHDSISPRFSCGRLVEDTFQELLTGRTLPRAIPRLTVVWHKEAWFAYCGNRRLFVFQRLEQLGALASIEVDRSTNKMLQPWKLTTTNDGTSVRVCAKAC